MMRAVKAPLEGLQQKKSLQGGGEKTPARGKKERRLCHAGKKKTSESDAGGEAIMK